MPRMRNNQGQRIDPRTEQPYESYNEQPQPEPRHQRRTRSDPQPTPTRPQPLALTYSQPIPGLVEHFLRSEFMREEVTPSPVTSRGSRRPCRTPEPATPQGPSRQDSFPAVEHPQSPFPWMPDNSGYVLLFVPF